MNTKYFLKTLGPVWQGCWFVVFVSLQFSEILHEIDVEESIRKKLLLFLHLMHVFESNKKLLPNPPKFFYLNDLKKQESFIIQPYGLLFLVHFSS